MSLFLPAQPANRYPGHWTGLVLFGLLTLFDVVTSIGSTVAPDRAAIGAEGIPVMSYGEAGAAAFLSLFSTLGATGLALSVFSVLALVRYRALIPFVALVHVLLAAGKRAINIAAPLPGRPDTGELLTLGTGFMLAYLLVIALAWWGIRRASGV